MPAIARALIEGVSPYSPSRAHETPFLDRERHDDYEDRTWREKAHYREDDGRVFIPPMAFKFALDKAASQLSMKKKGTATYTKHFISGVLCVEPLVLDITKDKVLCQRIYANADGKRGSGKRVWRKFPRVENWGGVVEYQILADEITEAIFRPHLIQSGATVGVGRFRPENGGFFGRFKVNELQWLK